MFEMAFPLRRGLFCPLSKYLPVTILKNVCASESFGMAQVLRTGLGDLQQVIRHVGARVSNRGALQQLSRTAAAT